MSDMSQGVLLKSGKFVFANLGIFGIDAEGQIWHGYDSSIDSEELTAEERAELAGEMIRRWYEFGKGDKP